MIPDSHEVRVIERFEFVKLYVRDVDVVVRFRGGWPHPTLIWVRLSVSDRRC